MRLPETSNNPFPPNTGKLPDLSEQDSSFYKKNKIKEVSLSALNCLNQDISYLSFFNEAEKISILECVQFLCEKDPQKETQKILVLWCKTLKESLGDAPFHLLLNQASLRVKSGKNPALFISIIQKLIEISDSLPSTLPLLEKFNKQEVSLKQLSSELDILKDQIDLNKFPEKKLDEIVHAFSSCRFPLPKEKLSLIRSQYLIMQGFSEKIKNSGLKEWSASLQEISKRYAKGSATSDDLLMLLAIGREAIKFKYKIYPNNTQIFTLLGLLTDGSMKGCINQTLAGEGKSTVIALLAFVCAAQGKTVNIICSSDYHGKRDQEKYGSFFKEFNFTSSHIYENSPAKMFSAQIIYGTNHNFEFAFMRDQLSPEKKCLWERNGQSIPRPFEIAIVDEVDNLFIDSSLNSARIAIPTSRKMEWIYPIILKFVKENKENIEKSPHISKPLLDQLRNKLHNNAYTNKQLETWIRNAFKALYALTEKRDYVIQEEEESTSKQITIVDWENTGRLNKGSRWQGGLHEFLEAKHGLEVQEESFTVAALCHPLYFEPYQKIYALTGTIGSNIERREMEQVYSLSSFDTPPHRKNLRQTLPPLIASSQEAHYSLILQEVQESQKLGRPVLILCKTIEETIHLSEYFKSQNIPYQLLNELQQENEEFIVARAGGPGVVTIATNTAGRGTDILLPPRSLEAGGLYVIFTCFPENTRVEDQGFARSGRQGQAGLCRLILRTNKNLKALLKEREDSIERASQQRISQIAKEKQHHKFLVFFWEQLQRFYKIPPNQFTRQSVVNWLDCARLQNLNTQMDLTAIEELVKLNQSDHIEFGKSAKTSLGILAQQYWAQFFYDKISGPDQGIDSESLYLSAYSLWESIFNLPESNTPLTEDIPKPKPKPWLFRWRSTS